jgi:predicted nucleic acid-binding protein
MPGMYLLPFPADLIDRTQALLERRPVTGSAVFDVQIVATMLGNGVKTIYTFDRKGFEPFEEIKVQTP